MCRFLFVLFTACFSVQLFALDEANFEDRTTPKQTNLYTLESSTKFKRPKRIITWADKNNIFFSSNIGIGFLYFSGVRGNLQGAPSILFTSLNGFRDVPLKGRFRYNRTPLFENILGYQFNSWLKLGLSYQYQGGVFIQSNALFSFRPTAGAGNGWRKVLFSTNLSLNALLAKLYFQLPSVIRGEKFEMSPYLGVGVGPGWQSWSASEVNYIQESNMINSACLPLRLKVSANAVWMIDLGIRSLFVKGNNIFSMNVGCKYNQWGQARSIGKFSQQGSQKVGLGDPVRIKTVYQFAPYLGAQWNYFPKCSSENYPIKGRNPNVWLPYAAKLKVLQDQKSIWTQFNVAVGFLYFSGVRGNLMGRPVSSFLPGFNFRDIPLRGPLKYNRTPLLEYLVGYRFNQWLKLAFSYQHQTGIVVQSEALPAYPQPGNRQNEKGMFRSDLELDSFLVKVYFALPYALIWKNLAVNPFLATGVGPGWQSWTATEAFHNSGNTVYGSNSPLLRQNISANAVWLIDIGLCVKSAYPQSLFSVFAGCKYNQWGQAKNIGAISKQGSHKIAITQPVRIKTMYQFAPYLGVQWNFSANYINPKPFNSKIESDNGLNCLNSIWTQFNAGIGFLYFSGLRGNLMFQPYTSLGDRFRDIPIRGPLSYNRTPLFEYFIGYALKPWLSLGLSYQYQGGVLVSTRAIPAFRAPVAGISETFGNFSSKVSLSGILAKCYFELPISLKCRSTALNPYLALGVGPGWQTWTSNTVDYSLVSNGFYGAGQLQLGQKVSANCIWMVDTGIRIQGAHENSKFSILTGCKYNQWGQARSIGKVTQQNSLKQSLVHPLSIKTVYQFAPYLGVQWNF